MIGLAILAVQVASFAYIASGACFVCQALPLHSLLSKYIVPLGYAHFGIVGAAIVALRWKPVQATAVLRTCAPFATAVSVTLIGASIAIQEYCWPCIVICISQVIIYTGLLTIPKRERILGSIFAIIMSVGAVVAFSFPDTKYELIAALGPRKITERTSWIEVGQTVNKDIAFEGRTELIIWTECIPCRQEAAATALPRFLEDNPTATIWTLANDFENLPSSIADRAILPVPFMWQAFGVESGDPPLYVILEGHEVTAIGALSEWSR